MNPGQTSSISVLLIEDNSLDAELVGTSLTKAAPGKFRVTWVTRLSDALVEITVKSFDVILLDLTLPDSFGSDGFLRLSKVAPSAPIIVLTGVKDDAVEKELMALGARDYVRKGLFDGRHLVSMLSNWVSLARRTQGQPSSLRQRVSDRLL